MTSIALSELQTYGPDRCPTFSYAEANAYTREFTRRHSENFTVVSRLLPEAYRDDFRHVYAFCRWTDDLGDEAGDPDRATELLNWWRSELDLCYADKPRHPVFVALRRTIQDKQVPREPFDHLIDAFVQDQIVKRYDTWEDVLDYCTRSANPVGRLLLMVCGVRDAESFALSDATCTALQLTNFWQDVRRDVLQRDRVYIPSDVASAHGLSVQQLAHTIRLDAAAGSAVQCAACPPDTLGVRAIKPAYTATLRELCDRTADLFERGEALLARVPADVRIDIELFTRGGRAVLNKIRRRGYDTLTGRPRLSGVDKAWLFTRAAVSRWSTR